MRLKTGLGFIGFFLLGFLAANFQVPEPTLSGTSSASANIVAVSSSGGGTLGKVEVSIEHGKGKVLLDTNPFVETDTQLSAKTAKNVAEKVTGVSLRNRNVVYSFSISGDFLGGPSAGAAMTLATIAAIKNKTVPDNVAVTGTIRPDGYLGKVGGVLEKAEAAGRAGLNTFYVPEGQGTITFYDRIVEEREGPPGFVFRDVEYVKRTVSIDNITETKYGMDTVEVDNIRELVGKTLD